MAMNNDCAKLRTNYSWYCFVDYFKLMMALIVCSALIKLLQESLGTETYSSQFIELIMKVCTYDSDSYILVVQYLLCLTQVESRQNLTNVLFVTITF